MFLGRYQHNLDYKGRTSIPKKFRDKLKSGAILTRGLDGCLFLYTGEDWDKLAARMSNLSMTVTDARKFSRYLFSGAVEVSFDNLGRITIPDYLRTQAELEKELTIVGVLNRIEIWSRKNWEVFNKKVNSESEKIAEKLSESGI